MLVLLAGTSVARADLLTVNGDFSSGLTGWTASGIGPVSDVDTFESFTIDHPGNGAFVRMGSYARLTQGVDLTGRRAVTLSFDYQFAAWDLGIAGGSSAPSLSPSGGRQIWAWLGAPDGSVIHAHTSVTWDEPWDGACWLPDPNIIIPACNDGTPSTSGWRHFEQTWRAPSGTFTSPAMLSMLEPGFPAGVVDERFAFYLDNVALTAAPIPEPSALLLIALAVVGGVSRVRRR